MKIVHITTVHKRYDTRIFLKQCKSLAIENEAYLVVADGNGDEVVDNVNIIDVGGGYSGRLARMILAPFKALGTARKLKADVYQIHDPELLPIAIILKFLGNKVIYDIHDEMDVQISEKTYIPKLIRKVVLLTFIVIEKIAIKMVDGVLLVNEKARIKYSKISKTTDFILVQNFPLVESTIVKTKKSDKSENRFVFVGTISPARGLLHILESIANSELKTKVKIDVVGPIPSTVYKNQLSTYLQSDFVKYHGFQKYDDAIEIIQKADAGFMVYQPNPNYTHTYPVKLFEYLLVGIPVIASNFPFWKELISKYNCGITVNPDSKAELIDAMSWVIENKKQAKEMGEQGRIAVINNFSWDSQFKNLINLYKSII